MRAIVIQDSEKKMFLSQGTSYILYMNYVLLTFISVMEEGAEEPPKTDKKKAGLQSVFDKAV